MGVRDQKAGDMVGVLFNGEFFHHFLEHSGAGETLLEEASVKGGTDNLPTPNHPCVGESTGWSPMV